MSDAADTVTSTRPARVGAIRPLDRVERRVLGALIEKAKTTPDSYPLSLSAVVTACNQKSNRDPIMTLDEEQVASALTRLRECGAVAEVYGNGRLARYRHLAYEWLADGNEPAKEEVSLLAELLLRGAQTEGDLRGRASRMDPIPDLGCLREHLDRMASRGLVTWLSPPGRGRMLTHGLLTQEELERVREKAEVAAGGASSPTAEGSSTSAATHDAFADLMDRVGQLETAVAELLARLATLEMESGPGRGG